MLVGGLKNSVGSSTIVDLLALSNRKTWLRRDEFDFSIRAVTRTSTPLGAPGLS